MKERKKRERKRGWWRWQFDAEVLMMVQCRWLYGIEMIDDHSVSARARNPIKFRTFLKNDQMEEREKERATEKRREQVSEWTKFSTTKNETCPFVYIRLLVCLVASIKSITHIHTRTHTFLALSPIFYQFSMHLVASRSSMSVYGWAQFHVCDACFYLLPFFSGNFFQIDSKGWKDIPKLPKRYWLEFLFRFNLNSFWIKSKIEPKS